LSFDWQFGEGSTYQTFSISFREPWLFGSRTSFGFSLFDTKQNYIYSVDQTGGTISLGRQFKFPDDYTRGDWIFRIQRIDNLSESDYYGPPGVIDQYSITQILSRSSIDNPIFPSHGSNISLSTELSGPPAPARDCTVHKTYHQSRLVHTDPQQFAPRVIPRNSVAGRSSHSTQRWQPTRFPI